jgi:hypothetical protein
MLSTAVALGDILEYSPTKDEALKRVTAAYMTRKL